MIGLAALLLVGVLVGLTVVWLSPLRGVVSELVAGAPATATVAPASKPAVSEAKPAISEAKPAVTVPAGPTASTASQPKPVVTTGPSSPPTLGPTAPPTTGPTAPPTPAVPPTAAVPPTLAPAERLAQARQASAAGNHPSALAIVDELRRADPALPGLDDTRYDLHMSFARALFDGGNLDGSYQQFEAALTVRPNDAAAQAGRNQIILAKNYALMEAAWDRDQEAAIKALEENMQLDPGFRETRPKLYALLIIKADRLIQAGERGAAFPVLMRALEVLPDAGEAQQRLVSYTPTPAPVSTATPRPAVQPQPSQPQQKPSTGGGYTQPAPAPKPGGGSSSGGSACPGGVCP